MKKLTKFYMLSFLLSAFVISSCTKDEITGEGDGNVIESEGYLQLSELKDNPVSLTAEQGTYILKILSDKEWTASISYTNDGTLVDKADEWCILSSKNGIDASEIYIGFSENKWNINRSATVNFSLKDSEETYSLALTQEAAETKYEFVSDDIKDNALTFKKSGQTYKVNLVTNAYEWTISLVDEGGNSVNWCYLEEADEYGKLSGKGDAEISIVAVENNSGTKQKAFLKFTSLETTFDNKLSLSQNNELIPFERLEHEIIDNGTDFKFNWSDETEQATFKLILAKDESYTNIIEEINDTQAEDNTYSIDLTQVEYGDYVGTVYAKLVCTNPADATSAIIEDKFNTHFDISSGDGTEASPYFISNARHLKNISEITETGKFFKLKNDIDLAGVVFTPLCATLSEDEMTYAGEFNNTLDGGNYTISGMTINGDYKCVGLFSTIGLDGVVKNLKLSSVDIYAISLIGSIAGKSTGGKVENCVVEGTIDGRPGSTTEKCNNIGGLIGQFSIKTPQVIKCINRIAVTSVNGQNIGGILGEVNTGCGSGSKINQCRNEAKITTADNKHLGGIIGYVNKAANISECSNFGTVIGTGSTELVGGVIGKSQASITLSNCYNRGNVFTDTNKPKTAGIMGSTGNANTKVVNCYNTGTISTNGYGITYGHDTANKYIVLTSCYSDGNICHHCDESKSTFGPLPEAQTGYAGWDFDTIWEMSDSYPKLQWEE